MTEQPTTPAATEIRRRPLGLTLAILGTAIGYGLIPLTPLLLVLWSGLTQREIGAELFGGPPSWVQIGFSVAILISAVLAWAGRPSWSRWLLIGLVWVQTAVMVLRFVATFTTPQPFIGVGGNFNGQSLWVCQAPLIIMIPLYVTWYLNRAPARAFYRR